MLVYRKAIDCQRGEIRCVVRNVMFSEIIVGDIVAKSPYEIGHDNTIREERTGHDTTPHGMIRRVPVCEKHVRGGTVPTLVEYRDA